MEMQKNETGMTGTEEDVEMGKDKAKKGYINSKEALRDLQGCHLYEMLSSGFSYYGYELAVDGYYATVSVGDFVMKKWDLSEQKQDKFLEAEVIPFFNSCHSARTRQRFHAQAEVINYDRLTSVFLTARQIHNECHKSGVSCKQDELWRYYDALEQLAYELLIPEEENRFLCNEKGSFCYELTGKKKPGTEHFKYLTGEMHYEHALAQLYFCLRAEVLTLGEDGRMRRIAKMVMDDYYQEAEAADCFLIMKPDVLDKIIVAKADLRGFRVEMYDFDIYGFEDSALRIAGYYYNRYDKNADKAQKCEVLNVAGLVVDRYRRNVFNVGMND